MAQGIDIDEMRETLHRVTVYKQVCEAVRGRANTTIFNGLLFLFLTGLIAAPFLGGGKGFPFIVFVFGAIGIGEILVGIWKKVAPSPEGVLVDGLLELAFVASVAYRAYDAIEQGLKPSTFSLIIGAWSLFNAFKTFQAYVSLRRAFTVRPSRSQLNYVEDLLADVREGDPATDATAMDFDTRPRCQAKLLGDFALVIVGKDEVALAERRQLRVDRMPLAKHPDNAALTVFGTDLGEFDLDPATWRNYAAWQTAGGNPPPPAVVRPAKNSGDEA
jgi:hypothetical protein